MPPVTFSGPVGTLEGFLILPQGEGPFPGVAVCHPHPLMGGDMNNNVVTAICRALEQAGMASLRFNFRGVGKSQGAYDEGRGEVDDALAALRFLAFQQGIEPGSLGLAGYSFGAGVALRSALQDGLSRALALVAGARLAVREGGQNKLSLPILFVVGDRDDFVPLGQLHELVARFATPPEIHIIPGADHFLLSHEQEAGKLVADFFSRCLSPASQA